MFGAPFDFSVFKKVENYSQLSQEYCTARECNRQKFLGDDVSNLMQKDNTIGNIRE